MNAVSQAAFPADPQRRVLIGKVHVAKKALALNDDDYRAVLFQVTGEMSSADCSSAQLVQLVEHFKTKGFKPVPGKNRGTGRRPADHPSARKARAMWISLHQLGAIDNPSEKALEAFAARQLKVEALQWANQAQCYKLIEALKAIAERHGWNQHLTVAKINHHFALKRRLAEAILVKLKDKGIAHESWSLAQAAYRLCGLGDGIDRHLDTSELEQIAAGLAQKLRQPVRPVSALELGK